MKNQFSSLATPSCMTNVMKGLLLAAPAFIILFLYFNTNHFFSNQYDDSYITYRYAINLASGNGLVFNVGEFTDSASSFLYTIFLSLFWLLGVKNLEIIGGVIGVISLWIICVYVYKLALYLVKDNNIALLVSFTCGLNGILSQWSLSGMETLPWAALILISLYFMVTNANYALTILAVSAAAFTRLEGIFLLLPFFIYLVQRKQEKWKLFGLFILAFVFCSFYFIKHFYYGVWISHAFSMKEIAQYYKPRPLSIIKDWVKFCSIPALLSIFVCKDNKYLAITLYLALSIASLLLGPYSDWSRYTAHLLPIIYAFSALALFKIDCRKPDPVNRAIFILISIAMLLQAGVAAKFGYGNMIDLSHHQVCRKQIGSYINEHLGDQPFIASSDLGAISYISINSRFVDLFGLTSADVLAKYQKGESPDEILREKKVMYIADTFEVEGANKFDHIYSQFGLPKKSVYLVDAQNPIFECSVNPNLRFQLNKIKLQSN